MNQNLARGIFLVVFALIFGVNSLTYQVGVLAHSGPGLFPAMISGMLLIIGIISIARAFIVEPVRMNVNFRNIGLITASLCGFALVSEFVNMTAGITFMVFCSTLGGSNYSWKRNLKISIALVLVAFCFHEFFGLSLNLI